MTNLRLRFDVISMEFFGSKRRRLSRGIWKPPDVRWLFSQAKVFLEAIFVKFVHNWIYFLEHLIKLVSLIGWLGNIYWLKKMFSRCEHGKIIIIIIQHSVNTCATGLSYERGHSSWRCENCQNRYGNKVVGKQQTPGLPCNPYLEMKLWSIVSQKRLSPST